MAFEISITRLKWIVVLDVYRIEGTNDVCSSNTPMQFDCGPMYQFWRRCNYRSGYPSLWKKDWGNNCWRTWCVALVQSSPCRLQETTRIFCLVSDSLIRGLKTIFFFLELRVQVAVFGFWFIYIGITVALAVQIYWFIFVHTNPAEKASIVCVEPFSFWRIYKNG